MYVKHDPDKIDTTRREGLLHNYIAFCMTTSSVGGHIKDS